MVMFEEGRELAKQESMLFMETSAKNGDHINQAFEELIQKVLRRCCSAY